MGTHISKVKSVDLDMWTIDQMNVSCAILLLAETARANVSHLQSIQKWGNHRVNLYWEAHLKAGHIPADQYVLLSPSSTLHFPLLGPPCHAIK